MKIELTQLKVRDVVEGYENNGVEGVTGYNGKLNIRPKYQREFVYKEEQRNAVIDTIMKGLPLNVMYWCKTEDGNFELMDGQQRTISFCEYKVGTFGVNGQYFHNLPKDKSEAFLDYDLFIYICEGTESEKLEWFKIINIAGEKLTDQELRNAVYSGPWVSSAKTFFSKPGCVASKVSESYVKGSSIRQEIFETALKWACDQEYQEALNKCSGKKEQASIKAPTIEDYMGRHQLDENAEPLWLYFRDVMEWVKNTFPKTRKEMKQVDWGGLYNRFGSLEWNAEDLESRVAHLMADYDVTKKAGIYDYVFSGNESSLSIRAFDDRTKTTVYEKQKGFCPYCKKHFDIEEMDADHKIPWSKGGKTIPENCQMLCKECNRKKSDK